MHCNCSDESICTPQLLYCSWRTPALPRLLIKSLCCQGANPFLGEPKDALPYHYMLLQPPEESLQSSRVRTPL